MAVANRALIGMAAEVRIAPNGAVPQYTKSGGVGGGASVALAGAGFTLTAVAAAALTIPSEGADDPNFRYVIPGKATNGDGRSWTTAYNVLPATLTRGLTYYCAGGSLPGRTFNTPPNSTQLITIKRATVADHGTSSGWSDTLATGTLNFTSPLIFTTSYFTIDGQTGSWMKPSETYGITVTELNDKTAITQFVSGTNHTLKHVRLQGRANIGTGGGSLANDAIRLTGATNTVISHVEVTDCGRCPVWGAPKGMLIEYFWPKHYNNGGELTHSEVMSLWDTTPDGSGVGNCEIRYSLFTFIQSSGGILWDGSSNASASCVVHGCVFYRPTGTTWEIGNGAIGGWSNPYEIMRNLRSLNNTFIEARGAGGSPLAGDGLSILAINCDAKNNLFYSSAAVDWTNFAHSHNHYISTSGSAGETAASTGSGNPFVDYVNLDFRLVSNTTGGTPLAAPYNKDALGNTRTTWTRGAFEKV